jgi:agmatine deiminase
LRSARDARGRRLAVHRIHQPGPITMTAEEAIGIDRHAGTHERRAGDRLPASYVNFYIANGLVVMPLYDARWDRAAMRTLRRLFPSRRIIGVPTREVLLGGGNIHCITQQVPRPVSRRARRRKYKAGS